MNNKNVNSYKAAMKLYGFAKDASEHAIVAELMEKYVELTK